MKKSEHSPKDKNHENFNRRETKQYSKLSLTQEADDKIINGEKENQFDSENSFTFTEYSAVEPEKFDVQQITVRRQFPEVHYITPFPSDREETPDYIPTTVRDIFYSETIEEEFKEKDFVEDVHDPRSTEITSNEIKRELNEKAEESMKELTEKDKEAQLVTQMQPECIQATTENIENLPEGNKASTKESQEELEQHEPKSADLEVERTVSLAPTSSPPRAQTPIPFARTELKKSLSSPEVRVEKRKEFYREIGSPKKPLRGIKSFDYSQPPVPPRRSFKDVIDSINRNQKRLQLDYPLIAKEKEPATLPEKTISTAKPALPSKDQVLLKLQNNTERRKLIEQMLNDLRKQKQEKIETNRNDVDQNKLDNEAILCNKKD